MAPQMIGKAQSGIACRILRSTTGLGFVAGPIDQLADQRRRADASAPGFGLEAPALARIDTKPERYRDFVTVSGRVVVVWSRHSVNVYRPPASRQIYFDATFVVDGLLVTCRMGGMDAKRKQKELSARQYADLHNMSIQTLYQWLAGGHMPPGAVAVRQIGPATLVRRRWRITMAEEGGDHV